MQIPKLRISQNNLKLPNETRTHNRTNVQSSQHVFLWDSKSCWTLQTSCWYLMFYLRHFTSTWNTEDADLSDTLIHGSGILWNQSFLLLWLPLFLPDRAPCRGRLTDGGENKSAQLPPHNRSWKLNSHKRLQELWPSQSNRAGKANDVYKAPLGLGRLW